MTRRVFYLTLFLTVIGLFFESQTLTLAAPVNSITFLSVTSFDPSNPCAYSINDSIQINARISVAPNVTDRQDTWTITNPMGMGMSMQTRAGSGGTTGKVFDGFMTMPIPSGTMPGDIMRITVQMVSVMNTGKTVINTASAAFNCLTDQFITSSSGGIALRFTDGRLNQEPEQSLTIYPTPKGGYDIYAVNQGVGSLALRITKAQLDANPSKATNTLIAQNLGVGLYRLPGGMLQAIRAKPDGKDYVFTWKG